MTDTSTIRTPDPDALLTLREAAHDAMTALALIACLDEMEGHLGPDGARGLCALASQHYCALRAAIRAMEVAHD